MKRHLFRSLGWCWLFAFGLSLHAAEIAVAAAADLKFALDELAGQFRTNHPADRIRITYGSSGNFYAQLRNQAPFDLYFSADVEYPRQLARAGFGLDTNVFQYAVGRLVVWAPSSSPINVPQLGAEALQAPSVRKIALANPKHAPYGVAAVAALKSLHLYEAVEPKLVYGDNVAQAAQFIETGAADIGIISLSLAVAPTGRPAGRYWEIPLDAYPKMEQGGLILKWTREPAVARAFRDFVLSPPGRSVLQRYGFSLPER